MNFHCFIAVGSRSFAQAPSKVEFVMSAKLKAVDALHSALKNGDVNQVRILLADQPTAMLIDEVGTLGYTALYLACARSDEKVALVLVQSILKAKAKVDLKGEDRETPLYIAVQNNLPAVVKLLLSNGANVNETNGPQAETAIHAAAKFGFDGIVQILIESNANINARTSRLETPLSLAAKAGRGSTVYLLLQNDANRSLNNDEGKNALYLASENGHKGVVMLLQTEKKDLKDAKAEYDYLEKTKPEKFGDPKAIERRNSAAAKREAEERKNEQEERQKEPQMVRLDTNTVHAERTHDPFTGKPLPPEFKSVVGASPPPYIPPGVVKPLKDERYGGTIRKVGTGTGMVFDEKPLVVDDVVPDENVIFSVNNVVNRTASPKGKKI